MAIMQVLFAVLLSSVCFRVPDIVPAPQEMSCRTNVAVRLTDGLKASVACPDPAAARWVEEKARGWFGIGLSVVPAAVSAPVRGEGYRLKAEPDGLTIEAESLQGVRYAMYTLRQAAEPVPEGRTLQGYWLPALDVTDAPALGFRGLHLCAFPELSVRVLEHQIRLAAYYKYNYVVLESWGMFRSEKCPFLAFKDAYLTVDESRRLATLARDLGVTLVPQFNVFGHAAGARSVSGKHVALDFHPERQPLFEPAGGWNWCLTNPETKRVQREIVEEMWEAFGRPAFFHLGCDEAHHPSCPDCQTRPYHEIVGEHVAAMASFVIGLGARPMVWQDMFLDAKDPKWSHHCATGDGTTVAALEKLPRETVICDWYYKEKRKGDFDFASFDHFKERGFDVVTCPCYSQKGCFAQSAVGLRKGIYGYMGTSWNYCFGGLYADVFTYNAFAAWGSPLGDFEDESKIAFMQHLRDVGHDTGLTTRVEVGVFGEQVPSKTACQFGWRGSAWRNWADQDPVKEDVSRWDPNMALANVADTNGIKWIDGRLLPVEGRAFDDVEAYYDRLPAGVSTNVNEGVRSMKHHTSGMMFRFVTDSRVLKFRWFPYSAELSMDHMPATGVSGIDVYRLDDKTGRWTYVKTGRISNAAKGGSLNVDWTPHTPCLVNLPLYNGLRSFALGVETNAWVRALPPRASGIEKPVVFYGTSITHGGCCSRPGLSYVNWVGRELDVPVVGLGFSGSGAMELEMSEHLARIDASCYVLDCLWNMGSVRGRNRHGRNVEENYEPFIRNLRAKRPNAPIVMAEQCDVFCGPANEKDTYIRGLYEKLVSEGWTNLFYLDKREMYSGDSEGAVDGVHPNDLGMQSMKNAFGKALRKALKLDGKEE